VWKRLRSRERAWERKGKEGKGREGKGKEGKGKETGDREKGYLIRENFQSRKCKTRTAAYKRKYFQWGLLNMLKIIDAEVINNPR